MSALALESPNHSLQPQPVADELIRRQVKQLFQARPQPTAESRRGDHREAFPYPIYITPISSDGRVRVEETIVVLGKHLSERGVDFYHEGPLPHRRVIASIKDVSGRWLGFLLDLRWCRSTRQGWYENGGRFLQAMRPPVANMPLVQQLEMEAQRSPDGGNQSG